MHALLIDDEVSARADLREQLAAHPGVTIVGEAATIGSARALLASVDYDLVFLDVQLIGGEGFQLVSLVRPGAHIIFATAHERYAARAFACNAVDYLLKPIDPGRLAEAVRRATEAHDRNESPLRPAVPHLPASHAASPTPFDPPTVNRVPPVPESFSEVVLVDHERVFLRQCLEAWEDSLPPAHALRVEHALKRTVRYVRDSEPTRLFLAGAPNSGWHRCWRALRARLAS